MPLLESVRQQRHRDENDHVRADDRHEPRDRSGDRHEKAKLPPVALQRQRTALRSQPKAIGTADPIASSGQRSAVVQRIFYVASACYPMLQRTIYVASIGVLSDVAANIQCCIGVPSDIAAYNLCCIDRRAIGCSAAQQPSPFSFRAVWEALGFRYRSADSAAHSRTVALFCLSPHCGLLSAPPVLWVLPPVL